MYRPIQTIFWSDVKIAEAFTPEDKYFYLYLLTNEKTTLTGCYEMSLKRAAIETGYLEETIKRLMERMELIHKVIKYDPETHEVLILNWHRYNWTKSKDLIKAVKSQADFIKNQEFREYILRLVEEKTVSTPSTDGGGTSNTNTKPNTKSEEKPVKHRYGEYKHVLLSDEDMEKLKAAYPDVNEKIRKLDEYIEETGKNYKNHYITITRWAKDDDKNKPKERKLRRL